jgi:putative endonuclease
MEMNGGTRVGKNTKEQGGEGEQLAGSYLRKAGMTIVETNYRFGRGEIDIIARDGETLVFCEVKLRMNDEYGEPEFAITQKKQQQIRKVAQGYLYERNITEQECRFDVVAIRMIKGRPEIRYIRNAF